MVPLTGAAGKGILAERLEVECCSWDGGGGLKFISRSEPALGASFQNKTAVSQSSWCRVASALDRGQSRFLSTAPHPLSLENLWCFRAFLLWMQI